MKANWTVGRKLGISFGALIALLLGLGLSSVSIVGKLQGALETTGVKTARKITIAGKIDAASFEMTAAERGMIVSASAKEVAGMNSAERSFQEAMDALAKYAQEIRPMLVLAEGKEALNSIEQQTQEWKINLPQVSALLHAGKVDEATALSLAKDSPLSAQIALKASRLAVLNEKIAADNVESGNALAETSRWIAIGLTLLACAIGVVVLFVIGQVSGTLRRLAGQLSDGAAQVAGAAGQVSAAGQSLAEGANEQAASLEETSASSEEIATMTQRNAENSAQAARLMVGTTESIGGANRKMEEMVRSMKEITASSGKISKIIKVIDEIAFQTNILALNAAVEAARAGEAGLGFAVVADEVRNLAQRCAQAARDTAELIEESINRSNDGSSRLAEVSTSIGDITEQSSKVKTLIDEIHSGSQEQSRGIEQVAGAVSQMQQVTQSSAASAEESAAAGRELASQAGSLSVLVAELNTLVGKRDAGENHGKPEPPRRGTAVAGFGALSTAVMRHSQTKTESVPDPVPNHQVEFPLDEVFK